MTVARSTNPEPATSPAPQISGANQSGVRAHNERVILSLLRRHGALSKAEIARLTGLRQEVQAMVEHCSGGHVRECRIIEVLADHGECLSDRH